MFGPRWWGIFCCFAIGCGGGVGAHDLGGPIRDLGVVDLSGPSGRDASVPTDLAMPDLNVADLAMPDLAMPDLAMPDLTTPDLTTIDLATAYDLARDRDAD